MNSIESDNYWKCVKSIASEASDLFGEDRQRFIEESVSGSEYTTYTLPTLVCLSCTRHMGAYLGFYSFRDLAYTSGNFTALASKVAYYAMLTDVRDTLLTLPGEEEDYGI
jgi:hypothetical protein